MAAITLEQSEVQKLLGAASGDAALVFLCLRTHGCFDAKAFMQQLRMSDARLNHAVQSLRQLGLFPEVFLPVTPMATEIPCYSEQEIAKRLSSDVQFSLLIGEVQQRMGRLLSTTDLKILLGLYDYLNLPLEVIGVLITFCIQRATARGDARRPSMRVIEQEGYRWADQGIDSVEAAAAYMQQQLDRHSAAGRIKQILQIHDRKLTVSEQNYVFSWLDLGMSDDAIALAYDKTCLNTGSMKWSYCNKIIESWAAQGLLTAEQIQQGDRKAASPASKNLGRAASNGTPGQYEREAAQRMLMRRNNGGN